MTAAGKISIRILALIAVLLCAQRSSAREWTFLLRNYETVRGCSYIGAIDYSVFRRTGTPQMSWAGYGSVPLSFDKERGRLGMSTEFDLGLIPRGEIKQATLAYTLSFTRDSSVSTLMLYAQGDSYAPDEVVLQKQLAPQQRDTKVSIEFNVARTVKTAQSHVKFELAGIFAPDTCTVFTGGRQGPTARYRSRKVLTAEQRPTLTIVVEAPEELPAPIFGRCIGLGETLEFADKSASYKLAMKPEQSALSNGSVASGVFKADAEGRFVIESTKNGVVQLATFEARRVVAEHPRLWITPENLKRLKDMRAAGHPGWLDLMKRTDSIKGAPSKGYGGYGYYGAMEALSLRYAVSGDKTFADQCKLIMEKMREESVPEVSKDAGFNIRAYGRAMALGFDRAYPELNSEEKLKFCDELNYWLAWYAAEGYQSGGPACGNYFSSYFAVLNMAAYATFQDNPRGHIILDQTRALFDRFILKEATSGVLRGGDNPEGRYADGYFESWIHYLIARQTAGGESALPNFTWPKEIALSRIHRLRPDRRTIYDCGAWNESGPSKVEIRAMLFLSELLDGEREGEYARRFVFDQLSKSKKSSLTFEQMLALDPNASERGWENEPLSYFSRGLRLATMRSSWDEGAVWASFQGGSPHFADHQHWDAGHWEIYRGSDPLVIDPFSDDEGAGTQFHNCILLDADKSLNPHNPGQVGMDGDTQAFEDAGKYVYVAGDFAKQYTFKRKCLVRNLKRQFLYIRPNIFILFDSFEPAEANYKISNRIHFSAPPEIDGTRITALKKESKICASVFGSSAPLIAALSEEQQENAVDITVPEGTGAKQTVMVLAALANGERAPEVSCEFGKEDVLIRISVPIAAEIRLRADGSPGGTINLDGKSSQLAAEIRMPSRDQAVSGK